MNVSRQAFIERDDVSVIQVPKMILGIEDILISWFVIMLALLSVVLLFVCCRPMICCKHLRRLR